MSPIFSQLFAVFVLLHLVSALPVRTSSNSKLNRLFGSINVKFEQGSNKDALPDRNPTVLSRESRAQDQNALTYVMEESDLERLSATSKGLTDNSACIDRFEVKPAEGLVPSFYYEAKVDESKCAGVKPFKPITTPLIFLDRKSRKIVVKDVVIGCTCGIALPDPGKTLPSTGPKSMRN